MKICCQIPGGACGFDTSIDAVSSDGVCVQLTIESQCPKVQQMGANLAEIDAMQEVLRRPLVETEVAAAAAASRLHTSCLVPVAVLKAIEAAAGLALPAESVVSVTRVDS